MIESKESYVKDIHAFPRSRADVTKPIPKEYFSLGLSNVKAANESDTYGPCIFIKPVWTDKTEDAIVSFELSKGNPKSSDKREKKELISFFNKQKIFGTLNPNDKAKVEAIDLVKEKKKPNATELWSCTENIVSATINESCNAPNLYLCWKWNASDIGID